MLLLSYETLIFETCLAELGLANSYPPYFEVVRVYLHGCKDMSDIIAINTDGLSSPSIKFKLLPERQGLNQFGWGLAWYPNDKPASVVKKDPVAGDTQVAMSSLTDWSNYRSTLFLGKIKGANKGYTHHETQPFSRSFAGRDWLFVHHGDLDKEALSQLYSHKSGFLEPIGKTDSEMAFCYLLAMVHKHGARKLLDVPLKTILGWFEKLDALGTATMILSDGVTVVYFHGINAAKALYYYRQQPPNETTNFSADSVDLDFIDPRDAYRTTLIFTTAHFSPGKWHAMVPGQLIVARRGVIVWDSQPTSLLPTVGFSTSENLVNLNKEHVPQTTISANSKSIFSKKSSFRQFEVIHTSEYKYTSLVEHSTHIFRVQPVDDSIQEIIDMSLSISTAGEKILFEDVFGNNSIYYSINTPYDHLRVESKSRLKVYVAMPDDHSLSRRQSSIPLIWMPWQQQMMMPYLLPAELPETQLDELTTYAMSFVERNDYHLLNTLKDMNLSIYNDYQYVPETTSLSTTPFEIYTSRKGVCQDFANLLICLARLLNIPARYRMGYIYTGGNYENKIQSEASHAWVEVYLPYVGWRGFDPTNGCIVKQDHVRVACGRNYRDATPTSGTIFKGGGSEVLDVSVKIEEI